MLLVLLSNYLLVLQLQNEQNRIMRPKNIIHSEIQQKRCFGAQKEKEQRTMTFCLYADANGINSFTAMVLQSGNNLRTCIEDVGGDKLVFEDILIGYH